MRAAGEADLNDPRLHPSSHFGIGAFVERHRNIGMVGTKPTKPAGQQSNSRTLDDANTQAAAQTGRVADTAGQALDGRQNRAGFGKCCNTRAC